MQWESSGRSRFWLATASSSAEFPLASGFRRRVSITLGLDLGQRSPSEFVLAEDPLPSMIIPAYRVCIAHDR